MDHGKSPNRHDDKGYSAPHVVAVDACRLSLHDAPWRYIEDHATAIAAHWQKRVTENPAFFDGTVYVLRSFDITNSVFSATLSPVPFSAFLHWRDGGGFDHDVRDAFGSAIVRSRDGHVMLGRQSPGHLNSGLAYFPGGFLDHRDARANGTIDLDASIARELAEETGLGPNELRRRPGYLITYEGRHISIGVEFRSSLGTHELLEKMRAGLGQDRERELSDIVPIASIKEAEAIAMPGHARLLLSHLLKSAG